MRRNCLTAVVVVALSVAGASGASAQGFTNGYTDIGPEIGVGGINGAGAEFGGRFEYGFKQLPNLGNGVLGFGVGVDYYSFSSSYSNVTGYSWKFIPIAATVNYHFHLMNDKIDPFLGLGLGYDYASVSGPSCTFSGVDLCSAAYSSGVYFVGHAGIRYFFVPNMALYVDAGAGYGALHVGLMFKVKG